MTLRERCFLFLTLFLCFSILAIRPAQAAPAKGATTAINADRDHDDAVKIAAYENLDFNLIIESNGAGAIVANPSGGVYAPGTEVELTATPDSGWVFSGWSGDLSGVASPDTVMMDTNKLVTGTFTRQYELVTSVVGNGSIVGNPTGGLHLTGTVVGLTAVPDSGWVFSGWSGDLTGSVNPDSVTMDGDKQVTATFTQQFSLATATVGSGSVTGNPAGALHLTGTVVGLTAVPDSGWVFSGWSGDLTGSVNPDSVTMDGDKQVTATFTREFTLATATVGSGSVVGNPAGGQHLNGTVVTLTAVPDSGWVFSGWSGDLTGSVNPDSVTMDGDKQVTATFTRQYSLATATVGSGSVTGNPAGALHLTGTVVGLTAVPDSGWVFSGWSGDLTGSVNPDSVIMDGDKQVTATFTQQFSLTTSATGSGAVVESPIGGLHLDGTSVTLTAVPDSGWVFSSWSGDHTGSANPDSVTMDSNKQVTAIFVRQFSLATAISGSGSLIQNPVGALHVDGTTVSFTATPDSGWVFTGWTGDLTGSANPDSVTMNADKQVTATFTRQYQLTTSVVGPGSIQESPAGGLHLDSSGVQLTAVPDPGYGFAGWSGDHGGVINPDSVVMDADKQVTATFLELFTLTTSTSGDGIITPDPNLPSYLNGTEVEVFAAGAPGWQFTGWGGDLSGSDNPTTITLDANKSISASFQDLGGDFTPVNFKIAFIADQGLGPDPIAVLNLIKDEGAGAVVHSGDFDYEYNPEAWEQQINSTLGQYFPYFATLGEDDDDIYYDPGSYQDRLEARMNRINRTWDGNYGHISSQTYNDIFFVFTSPGVESGDHEEWIEDQLGASNAIWRISSFHKNQKDMALGEMSNSAGWDAYELSRQGGAFVVNGQMHAYARTHLLSHMEDQVIASTSDTLLLTHDIPETAGDDGKSFVALSGLGGRSRHRGQSNLDPWWAAAYDRRRDSKFGALFGEFNYNGNPYLAHFYFKNVDNEIIDDFYVYSANANYKRLTTNISGPGSITLDPPGGIYAPGMEVRVTATPDSGFNFVGWSGDHSGSLLTTTITMNDDKDITATFAELFALGLTTTGSGNLQSNPADSVHFDGTSVVLTAVPDSGWAFQSWSGDLTGGNNPDSLIMNAAKTVNAAFIQQFALNVALIGSGSVQKNPDLAAYDDGSQVALTAVPDSGWVFTSWEGDTTGSENPINLSMNSDKSVTARFTRRYALTALSAGSGSVALLPAGGVYDEGSEVALTANPAPGWVFTGWSDDLGGSVNPDTLTMDSDKQVTANFFELFAVNITTNGAGNVTMDPPGPFFSDGTEVGLTAVADSGWAFRGWSGDLTGLSNPDSIVVDTTKAITATFVQTFTLTSAMTGSGTLVLDPDQSLYDNGTIVGAVATPDSGWIFSNWTGDLTGSANSDSVLMNGNKTITANFTRQFQLTTSTVGSGQVTPDSGSLHLNGAVVPLTATPDSGWAHVGWSGDLSGSANPDSLTMDSDKQVTATFMRQFALGVATVGNGSVNLNPGGGSYLDGTQVGLQAVPDSGWAFVGWSGALSGSSATDSLIMDGDKQVTATFIQRFALSTNITGSGIVNLSPAGGVYDTGTGVEVTAVPDSGWIFSGWQGDLTGLTNPDSVTMNADKAVTAVFTRQFALTSSVQGNGSVSNTPAGPVHNTGTVIHMTATPDSGWVFDSWSGDLTGSANPDSLSLDSDKQVTANFTQQFSLNIAVAGGGIVTPTPPGALHLDGTIVSMTAVPDSGWRFVGWSGDLTGSANPDSIAMDADKNLTATFIRQYSLNVANTGSGTTTWLPNEQIFDAGTVVTLTANPDSGAQFLGWSGDLAGSTSPEVLTMDSDKAVAGQYTQMLSLDVIAAGPGTVVQDLPGRIHPAGTSIQLTAVADSAARFVAWSGDTVGTTTPMTVALDSNMTVNGSFIPLFELQTATEGAGTVSSDPAGSIHDEGTAVALTATPDSGWVFIEWLGDLTGSAGQDTVTMDANKAVTARFRQLFVLDLTIDGTGSVTRDPATGPYVDGTQVVLTPVDSPGWIFTGWSGDLSGVSRPDTLTMDSDKQVTADFNERTDVVYEETQSGGSSDLSTVATSSTLSGVSGHVYLAAISSKPKRQVLSVSGLGLTWTLVQEQCSGRDQTGLEVWMAQGTPTGPDVVEASLSESATNAVISVSRYSGAAAIGNITAHNTNGEFGGCSGGSDTSLYSMNLTTTGIGSVVYGAAAMRGKSHTPGSSFIERAEVSQGAGSTASVAVEDQLIGNPTSLFVDGSFSGTVDWAAIGIEIKSGPARYDLTANVQGQGTVALNPGSGTYYKDDQVSVTASPAAGWRFIGWSGDLSGSINPENVLMDGHKVVTAIFAQEFSLTLNTTGSGSLQSNPADNIHVDGTNVVLTASPDSGWALQSWSGDLTGSANPDSILMDANKSITANFIRQYALDVATQGAGSVQSNPALAAYPNGSQVELTAVPDSGWVFSGWSGDLGGSANSDSLTMDSDKQVTATFTRQFALATSIIGSGSVTVNPPGALQLIGTIVNFTAVPDSGWIFAGWSGDLTSSVNPDSLTMDSDKQVTATFIRQFALATSTSGSGSVVANPPGGLHLTGTTATLTAVPDSGWGFGGWSGDLSGSSNPDSLTMDSDKQVTANFIGQYALTTSTSGSGSVIVDPPGALQLNGTLVNFTAVPDSGWVFTGWSGDLSSSTNPDSLTMDSNKQVTAIFSRQFALATSTSGSGSVVANPPGGLHLTGSTATLTAVPDSGWAFGGWSGDLSSSVNPDSLTMDSDKQVTANFIGQYALATSTSGSGSVVVDPPGALQLNGTIVNFTAVPDSGWVFSGWSGDLNGSTNPDSLTMDSDKQVTAIFTRQFALATATSGSGSVVANPPGGLHLNGTLVNFAAVPDSGWVFAGWSGDLSGSASPDSLTMDSDKQVTANFIQQFAIGINIAGGGSVTTSPPGALHLDGTIVSMTAAADSGWRFVGWSGDLTGSANPDSIAMNSDKSVTATFIRQYSLTVVDTGSGSTTWLPNQGIFDAGTVVTLSANPDSGAQFLGWSGDLAGVTTPEVLTMDSDKSVTGHFTQLLTLDVAAIGLGHVVQDLPGRIHPAGTSIQLTAVADSAARFGSWSGDLTGSSTPATVVLDSNMTVNGNFISLFELQLTTEGAGTVTQDPAGGIHDAGTAVALTATPDSGWAFSEWVGDLTGSASQDTVTLDANKQVTARFKRLFDLELTILGIGSVTRTPANGPYIDGTQVQLDAVDSPGWIFTGWSGDLSGDASQETLLIDGDKQVTATFTEHREGVFEETLSGGSSGAITVSTSGNLTGVTGDMYLAAISSKPNRQILSISGLGLTWILVQEQCSGRDQVGLQVWKAQGTPTGDGVVEATFDSAPTSAVISVTRYSGASAIGNVTSSNTNGEFGGCSGGADNSSYAMNLTTTGSGSVVYGAAAMRSKSHTPGSSFSERDEISQGSGGSTASVAVQDQLVNNLGTLAVDGSFSGSVDWAAIGVEILSGPVQYDLSTNVQGQGSVDLSPGGGVYYGSTLVDVTAIPAAGWVFAGWSGDLSGTTNPGTVSMDGSKQVTATFMQQFPLNLNTTGSGTIQSNPADSVHAEGTQVTLTAIPDSGWVLQSWSGDLSGSTNPEAVTMNAAKNVTANFIQQFALDVATQGSGNVQSNPTASAYDDGSQVELNAVPDSGWVFSGWQGAATGSDNPLNLTMNSNKSLTATFTRQYALAVVTVGTGTVTLSPNGGVYDTGTEISAAASPAPGWRFDGWSGDLAGAASPDTVTMDSDKQITATFVQIFSLTSATTGSGTLIINPDQPNYDSGSVVGLTATPDSGWTFANWTGDLAGSDSTESLVMNGNKTITANFSRQFQLNVSTTGSGQVSPDSGSLYLNDTIVPVTATADSGWVFVSWSGDMSGSTNPQSVTMDADKQITATFMRQFALGVTAIGNGTVNLDPAGGSYVDGTQVGLQAVPDSGWVFVGWSGALTSSSASESLTMNGDKAVTATFIRQFALDTHAAGSGTVTLSPAGGVYDTGTGVQLTAAPSAGWIFSGWQGDLTGSTNPDSVTVDSDKSVTAVFTRQYTLTTGVQGGGTISSNPPGGVHDNGTVVVFTATPDSGWGFSGWSDDLSGSANPDSLTMDSDRQVTANFTQLFALNVTVAGGGSITSAPDSGPFADGTNVTVTAAADSGWRFVGWSGALTGSTNPGNLSMDSDKNLTATFIRQYSLSVANTGSGATSWLPNQTIFDEGAVVTLSANPDSGAQFLGWSGDLSGTTTPKALTMDADKNVTGQFSQMLSLDVTISGPGSVVQDLPGRLHPAGTSIQLTAVADSAGLFSHWSGDLTGSSTPTSVVLDSNMTVNANFNPLFSLQLSTEGSGAVSADPAGGIHEDGTRVGLTATPDPDWVFSEWSGDLSGTTNPDSVTMDANKQVIARFKQLFDLTLTIQGSGTVTPTPGSGPYADGTLVGLNAIASPGWIFTGWSGDLAGTASQETLAIDGDKQVTATFTELPPEPVTLSFSSQHDGQVKVTAPSNNYGSKAIAKVDANEFLSYFKFNVSGIGGAVISAKLRLYVSNGSVQGGEIYAVSNNYSGTGTSWEESGLNYGNAPAPGGSPLSTMNNAPINTFVEFDLANAINGNGTYSFAINPLSTDRVDYHTKEGINPPELLVETTAGGGGPNQYDLSYAVVGQGSVALNPPGGTYDDGTVVSATATPAAGWQFAGWSGDLSGSTNPDNVTVDANKQATATFTEIPPNQFTLTTAVAGQGSVTLNPPGGTYDEGTVVSATATPAAGWQFAGWSGDLSGSTNPDNVTVDANKQVTATFTNSGGSTLTFAPIHDGQVKITAPGNNYGSKTITKVDAGEFLSYFKFNVTGVSGTITSAKLRLYVANGSPQAGEIHSVSNNYSGTGTPWEESGLTYGNAPAPGGSPLSSLGEAPVETFVEFDLGNAITGNGTYSFAISPLSTNRVDYHTKENTNVPELIIETTSGGGGGPTQFNLTTSAQGQGSVTLNPPGGTYDDGTQVSLTASPSAGWQFAGWSGDLSGSNNPDNVTVNANKQVTATFTEIPPNQFALTTAVVGQGTIGLNPSGGTYDDGTVVSATATPAAGWQFAGWSGDLSGNNNPENVTVDANKQVTATFTEIPLTQFTLTSAVQGQGSVTLNPSGGTYDDGTQVSVTATPAAGWQFTGWSGDLSGSTNPESVIVNANKQVTATFVEAPPVTEITFAPSEDGHVRHTRPGNNYGGDAELKLKSGVYETFLKFNLNGIAGSVQSAILRLYVTDPGSDGGSIHTVSNDYLSTATPWVEDGLAGENAPLIAGTPLSSIGAITLDTWVEFDVTAAIAGNGTVSFGINSTSGSTLRYSSKEGSNPPELVVQMAAADSGQFILATSTIGSGSISLNPAGGVYDEGTVVSVTATPQSGWLFDGWSNGLSGTNNPESITMNAHQQVTATFIENIPPQLTLTAPNGAEEWIKSTSHDITWNSQGPVGNVDIEYSLDAGLNWLAIVNNTSNDGSYNWSLPDAESDQALVRVSSTGGGGIFDVSDQVFSIVAQPVSLGNMDIVINADDEFELWVNGNFVGSNGEWDQAQSYSVPLLAGENLLAVHSTNLGFPGGLIAEVRVNGQLVMVTDGNWRRHGVEASGWNQPGFDDGSWSNAVEHGQYGTDPWYNDINNFPSGSSANWIWGEVLREDYREWYFRGTFNHSVAKTAQADLIQDNQVETVRGPQTFSLEQNYPNPFNPQTTIRFDMPVSGHVQLSVFDIKGNLISVVTDATLPAGSHTYVWQPQNKEGSQLPSGMYFYRLQVGDVVITRKMTILR